MADLPLLAQIKGVRLSLGGAPLFEDVDLTLAKQARIALVGANGTGKSTLMRMLAGLAESDAGEVTFAAGATVAFAEQDPDLSGFPTLRAYAEACSGARGAHNPAHRAEAALESFGLDPDRAPIGLSGGETRRASLARAFAATPDILLLDEPTNHLDIPAIEALEARLRAFKGAALLISHDRRFLERVSTACFWLTRRRVLRFDRGFAHFEPWAAGMEEQEARTLAKLETQIKTEEQWVGRSITARRTRNEGRMRRLEQMRAERRRRKGVQAGRAVLEAEKGADSARLVIEAKQISKGFGDRRVVRELSIRILRGDRIGIVGPNGAGKTTLLEILLKRLQPDTGNVRHGARLEIAYIDQARALLKPTDTIWDALVPQGGDQVMVRGRPRHVAGYAKEFLFPPSMLRQPIGALSGGERNRVALAVALAQPSNVLVLDEPTNDLDMDTLDALEDMLSSYEGTVLIVSHDRAFLDGVTTQILGSLGGGAWAETPGGYADFEREHPRRERTAARTPGKREARPSPGLPVAARPEPKKLSFKDEHRQSELNALVARLHAEVAELEARLAAPDFFARDAAAFHAAAQRLDEARRQCDAAETEWLMIEERRSKLAAGRD
jgi:ATP-binding cassette subfamily F protein uup